MLNDLTVPDLLWKHTHTHVHTENTTETCIVFSFKNVLISGHQCLYFCSFGRGKVSFNIHSLKEFQQEKDLLCGLYLDLPVVFALLFCLHSHTHIYITYLYKYVSKLFDVNWRSCSFTLNTLYLFSTKKHFHNCTLIAFHNCTLIIKIRNFILIYFHVYMYILGSFYKDQNQNIDLPLLWNLQCIITFFTYLTMPFPVICYKSY